MITIMRKDPAQAERKAGMVRTGGGFQPESSADRKDLPMVFTEGELAYLRSQRLGRLATLAADGTLQNNPVGFSVDQDAGVINVGGRDLGNTRKFRNVAANGQVAFVVDDIASVDPWVVRCFEVRGSAEALTGQTPASPYMSAEIIRIHPRRIISWGMGTDGSESSKRTVR